MAIPGRMGPSLRARSLKRVYARLRRAMAKGEAETPPKLGLGGYSERGRRRLCWRDSPSWGTTT
jgi:hypothetical protein